jgi:CubicO group peptidase (beta-lactamase class C family)
MRATFSRARSSVPCRSRSLLWIAAALATGRLAAPPPALALEPRGPRSSGVRDISNIIDPIREKAGVPGMVAAVVRGGRIVARGASGLRSRDSTQRVTIRDKFHIGSCTKAMTATLLATLVEEGRLKWDTTIADVWPELSEKHPPWRAVTLSQLLAHRGGAPAELDAGGLWGKLWNHKGTPTEARRLLLEGVLSRSPQVTPGTSHVYSNAGYAIAGHMAEEITGESWEHLMQERIFKPLAMKSAGFGAPGRRGKVDQPRGHDAVGKPVEPGPGADNPPAIGPAGTVHCSISDWARFAALHLQAGRGGGRLLRPGTFAVLHTPFEGKRPKYALGWAVTQREWAGPKPNVLNHAGSNTMWFAVVWIAPDKDLAVLVAANQGPPFAARACDQAASALIQDQTGAGTASGKPGGRGT